MTAANRIKPTTAVRFRPRRPPVIMASHSRQASLSSCRANQESAVAELMRRRPSTSTSAMNRSSRLVLVRPFCCRNSVSVPSATSFPDAMTPMRSAMRSATSRICVVMITVQPARTRSPKQPLDVTRGYRIEPGQRFVEDDQAGIVDQRAGQRHLLAHALGKSLAALVEMRRKAERDQKLMRASLRDFRLDAPEAGDEFEIFQRRQFVVDHRLVGHPRHHLLGGDRFAQRVDAEYPDRSGVGPQQACDHAQRRGLAGTVGSDQGVELAGTDGEIECVDRGAVKTLC